MNFHEYRTTLAAAAVTALGLCTIGASAKSDLEGLFKQNPATAEYGTQLQSSSIKGLFSRDALLRGGGVCGDSSPDEGEECDDGNLANGDGCSATCTVEPGFDCSMAIAGEFSENLLPNGSFADGDTTEWTETSVPAGFGPISSGANCGGCELSSDTDNGWIWNGGLSAANVSTATTIVTIPATATTLQADIWEGFCVPDNGTGDVVTITIDGNEVFNTGVCTTEAFYAQADTTIDLATAPGGPYNDGGMHTIVITGDMDLNAGDPQTGSIFVDNIRINVPLANPIPPVPSACSAVICGDGVFPQFSAAGTEECDDGNLDNGDGCSNACTVEQPNFVCEDPEAAAAEGEALEDGGLEDGLPNGDWVVSEEDDVVTQFEPICSQVFCGPAIAADGAWYAWFGGSALPNLQTLAQTLIIPATADTLDFEMLVGICDSVNDTLAIDIDGTEVYNQPCTATLADEFNIYSPVSVDISAFADGGEHTVTFTGNTVATNGGNSNYFVDNISIGTNAPFGGEPGQCFELREACTVVEEFEAGIPGGWTVINSNTAPADGWGTSNDGICASGNWSGGNADNNVTGGGGVAACADSDATGQIAVTAGGEAVEMDTFLCTPALDLTLGLEPTISFLVNYQSADNDAVDDNGTPDDFTDDRDLDLLEVLIGTVAPSTFSLPNYTTLGNIFDHLDTTLALSPEEALAGNLADFAGEPVVHACFHYRGTFAWFAQVDNVAVRALDCTVPNVGDSDGDGVTDDVDNCTNLPNPTQGDADGDGYGNRCDADLDNNCIVNVVDLGILRSQFFQAGQISDFNEDGITNVQDLGILRSFFFQAPGPSPADPCTP